MSTYNNPSFANAIALGFGFTTASNAAGIKIPTPNRVIPNAILDKCADLLGFTTRNNYPLSAGSGVYCYNTGYGSTDYIGGDAWKGFKIFWGSLTAGTVPASLQSNVINTF